LQPSCWVLTQPLFFLILPGLVRRSLWDPLIRALRVPVRLPRLVWISSGCGSAVIRRSSQSLRGFGVSLPVAWSHPTLAGIKLVIRCSTASYLGVHQPTVVKIGPTLYRYPIGTYQVASSGGQPDHCTRTCSPAPTVVGARRRWRIAIGTQGNSMSVGNREDIGVPSRTTFFNWDTWNVEWTAEEDGRSRV
jgi:hypothetical protein